MDNTDLSTIEDEIDALNRRARILANRHALDLLRLELGIPDPAPRRARIAGNKKTAWQDA